MYSSSWDRSSNFLREEVIMLADELYTCETCGNVTTGKGHLCDPIPGNIGGTAHTCEYCGVSKGNPRHICKPKLAKIRYTCETCGRVAVDEDLLCKPKKIS